MKSSHFSRPSSPIILTFTIGSKEHREHWCIYGSRLIMSVYVNDRRRIPIYLQQKWLIVRVQTTDLARFDQLVISVVEPAVTEARRWHSVGSCLVLLLLRLSDLCLLKTASGCGEFQFTYTTRDLAIADKTALLQASRSLHKNSCNS